MSTTIAKSREYPSLLRVIALLFYTHSIWRPCLTFVQPQVFEVGIQRCSCRQITNQGQRALSVLFHPWLVILGRDRFLQFSWVFVRKRLQCSKPEFEIVSLISYCIHGKCSDELLSLVPPRQTFIVRTSHATYIVGNHSHSLRIPSV